jgi:hypothetical protein
LAITKNRKRPRMKTAQATAVNTVRRRIQAANFNVDKVVHDLGPDVAARAAKRAEERSKAAKVSQKDLQLQISI